MDNKEVPTPVAHPRLTKLMQNPVVWAFLAILSIAGIVLTIITFFPPVKKQFIYSLDSRIVISPDESMMDGLDISFLGNKINELRSTNIIIRNNGSEAIKATDIASSRPLSVHFMSKGQIYKTTIINVSNTANMLSIKWTPGSYNAEIGFEFMNPNDYFILQVLHSLELPVDIDIAIIGEKENVKFYDPEKEASLKKNRADLSAIIMTLSILIITFLPLTKYYFRKSKAYETIYYSVVFFLYTATFISAIFFLINIF